MLVKMGPDESLNLTVPKGGKPHPNNSRACPTSSLCMSRTPACRCLMEKKCGQGISIQTCGPGLLANSQPLLQPFSSSIHPNPSVQSTDPKLPILVTYHDIKYHQTEPHTAIMVHSYSIHPPGFNPSKPDALTHSCLPRLPAVSLPALHNPIPILISIC